MYRWIWNHIPFGMAGRLAGTAVLVVGAAALLWFVVFPAVDPLLPWNDGQVTAPGGGPPTVATSPR